MSIDAVDLMKWNRISLGLGATVWVLIVLSSMLGWVTLSDLELILLLALWVITPVVVPLATTSKEPRLLWTLSRLILFLQPFAALIGGIAFFLSTGLLAGAAAGVWLLFTALLALLGLVRLREIRTTSLADACLAIAMLYVPIGGAWLVLARLGLQPLGFGLHTDLLTAIHFHYIPLAALTITGLIGQVVQTTRHVVPRMLYRAAARGMLINPLLVATGITLAQVTGDDFVESAAATLLALSLISIALLSLRFIIPTTTPPLAKGLLLVSSTAIVFTMLVAGAYVLGAATGAWTITISQMIAIHGWINALAFGVSGLLGWRLRARQQDW